MDDAKSTGFSSAIDLNKLPAGTVFDAFWSFNNIGTTTWGEGYTFRYVVNGYSFNNVYKKNRFGIEDNVLLEEIATPYPVKPGKEVVCKLSLQAPLQTGVYVAHWQLYDPNGKPFGKLRYIRPVVVSNLQKVDLAKFVSFQCSADLAKLEPGQTVQVHWQIRNVGTSTWKTLHQLRFSDPLKVNSDVPNLPLARATLLDWLQVAAPSEVAPNQIATLSLWITVPEEPGEYATHWRLYNNMGIPFGGTLWLRVIVKGTPTAPVVIKPPLRVGMNINPDQPISNPVQEGHLYGVAWVRYPFKATAKNRSIADSFVEYDPLVEQYVKQGIKTLFILNQETVWGSNAPWANPFGSWDRYVTDLAAAAGEIANHYASYGDKVGYQLWNEGDNPHTPWVSIFMPPYQYANMIEKVTAAIRAKTAVAPVIGMGTSAGQDESIAYLLEVKNSLKNGWPLTAIAAHPYGRWFNRIPFPNWGYGSLELYLQAFKLAFPDIPLWITEIGVPGGDKPIIGTDKWQAIGEYMKDIYTNIAERHSAYVPVVIWFAWSDLMENAGIVQADGTAKLPLQDSFVSIVSGTQSTA